MKKLLLVIGMIIGGFGCGSSKDAIVEKEFKQTFQTKDQVTVATTIKIHYDKSTHDIYYYDTTIRTLLEDSYSSVYFKDALSDSLKKKVIEILKTNKIDIISIVVTEENNDAVKTISNTQ